MTGVGDGDIVDGGWRKMEGFAEGVAITGRWGGGG